MQHNNAASHGDSQLPAQASAQFPAQAQIQLNAAGADTAPGHLSVAFQGEPGAYSEQALRQFFCSDKGGAIYPDKSFAGLKPLPCANFRGIFAAVQDGRADFATVPLENSLAGSIMENYDLLLEYPQLCICAETRLRVSHMLIAAKGSELRHLKTVRSHPQALAQSSHFIERHGLQAVANFDTAGSVRELSENPIASGGASGKASIGAIASALAAEIYDMKILARAIENNPHNYTRFAIVCDARRLRSQIAAWEKQRPGQKFGDKWSICLRLRNFSGSLARALQIFQHYELDLTKLESRPIMGQPWSYRFYLDTRIAGDLTPAKEAEFFGELGRISEEYRVIGRYWENLE